MQPLGRPSGIPLRRKLLFGMLALLVLYSGYAWYAGLAFTAGIETQDMDWNGDGSVSTQETMQSWYAVNVRSTKEGRSEERRVGKECVSKGRSGGSRVH